MESEFEVPALANWSDAVMRASHNFVGFRAQVIESLASHNPEIRSAASAKKYKHAPHAASFSALRDSKSRLLAVGDLERSALESMVQYFVDRDLHELSFLDASNQFSGYSQIASFIRGAVMCSVATR